METSESELPDGVLHLAPSDKMLFVICSVILVCLGCLGWEKLPRVDISHAPVFITEDSDSYSDPR